MFEVTTMVTLDAGLNAFTDNDDMHHDSICEDDGDGDVIILMVVVVVYVLLMF